MRYVYSIKIDDEVYFTTASNEIEAFNNFRYKLPEHHKNRLKLSEIKYRRNSPESKRRPVITHGSGRRQLNRGKTSPKASVQTRIDASGPGKGWHKQPVKHSIASKKGWRSRR